MRDRAAWAGVIEEIRSASNLLPQCRVMHAHHEANRIAHELAKRGLLKHCVCGHATQHASGYLELVAVGKRKCNL
jgi:hypothetical protein